MKITLDVDVPRWTKTIAKLALPALALGVIGVAWSAPLKTFAPGETLRAADLNQNFALLTHPPSAFRAYRNAPLSVPDDATQNVAFDTEIFDAGNEYNPTTGAFTATGDGIYSIQCGFLFVSIGNNLYGATIYKNGVEIDSGSAWSAGTTANTTVKPSVSQIESLKAGDTVQCGVYQHTGAAESLMIFDARNSFSVARLD